MVLIFTVVLITTRNKHQLSIGGPVVFTKCPFSDMSVGRNVRWARLPLAELSVRRNVHYTNCPLCELSVSQTVCQAKCPLDKMSIYTPTHEWRMECEECGTCVCKVECHLARRDLIGPGLTDSVEKTSPPPLHCKNGEDVTSTLSTCLNLHSVSDQPIAASLHTVSEKLTNRNHYKCVGSSLKLARQNVTLPTLVQNF